MVVDLASAVDVTTSTPSISSSTSSLGSGENLWSLRRRIRVNAPGDNEEFCSKGDCAKVGGSLALGSLHALRHSREDRCGTRERSSKLQLDRLSHLLQRFDAVDASNPRRLKMVGTFSRANYLLESAHKVAWLLEEQQQGKDTNKLSSLRDVFLVTESHLEELLLSLWEPTPTEHSAAIDPSTDKDRLSEDDLTSDPWDDCEDISSEDLLEFFTDSLKVQTNPETVIATTAVEDLLKVCWQQGESLRSSEARVPRPLSRLVDLDLQCDTVIGTGVDSSDCNLDKRGSHGTASTASFVSATSISSISTVSTGSSVRCRWPSRTHRLTQVVEIGNIES